MIYYYGDVSVTYGNMKLTADYMEYDLNSGTLYARGTKDTTGVITGQPVMEQGGKSYTMEEVRYNFNTMKARITNMVTQEQDGILHGKNIKMMPDKSINITNGKYTVCDCEHPPYCCESDDQAIAEDGIRPGISCDSRRASAYRTSIRIHS